MGEGAQEGEDKLAVDDKEDKGEKEIKIVKGEDA